MTSHDLAREMQETAKALLSKPEFKIPSYITGPKEITFFSAKEDFLQAVKLSGSGKKDISGPNYVTFIPDCGGYKLSIDRSLVCKKIKEAVYECEPLLSQLEESTLEPIRP